MSTDYTKNLIKTIGMVQKWGDQVIGKVVDGQLWIESAAKPKKKPSSMTAQRLLSIFPIGLIGKGS
ncbi:hypothetical protein [Singulisphaera acidiphila]|uniref:hypothetical protein n=1 Tax=Singulisphaera acidiphila TaxID=466153 RepID=UPI0012B60A45|nr:hypothetical protein [Singulisphaera acidiphila]